MPKKITNIIEFLKDQKKLLQVVIDCCPVLFSKKFQKNLKPAWKEVSCRLDEIIEKEESRSNNAYEENNYKMDSAGLTGAQAKLKFRSYSDSSEEFEKEGFIEDLEDALEKGSIILKSIAGAIPSFGSFAQEFIEKSLES